MAIKSNRELENLKASYKRTSKDEVIIDATGVYSYETNPTEYMKARKYFTNFTLYRRQQNRESATRTRQRKTTYITQLEQHILKLNKENQELKILNASLTTENELLRKQVEYFQGLVANQKEVKPHEEILCPDEPQIKESDEPILHYDDSDYGFYGHNAGRESPMSPSAFYLTIIFVVLCVVSFFNPSGRQSQGSSVINPNYGPKTTIGEEVEKGKWELFLSWVLDPYLLILLYMIGVVVLLLRHEKEWTKGKWRRLMARLRSHNKTS